MSWYILLKGMDMIGIAKTGCGKTLGYLIPLYVHLLKNKNRSRFRIKGLILGPTKESI